MAQPSRINWLSDDELNAIHDDSLNILWERGMQITHSGICSILSDAGAKIDKNTNMVHFPPEIVEQSIHEAPNKIVLGGRTHDRDLDVGANLKAIVRPITGTYRYVDLNNRTHRLGTGKDLQEWTRLLDALNNIHLCSGFLPDDVPKESRVLFMVKTMLENTTKPVTSAVDDPKQFKTMIDMAIAIRGDKKTLRERPLLCCLTSATSPGALFDYCVENVVMAGDYGIPMELNSTPLLGGTAPITIAGAIVQINVEILSLITISQLANPGSPVIYRGIPSTMDMASGISGFGAIECGIAHGALCQLAKEKYNLPVSNFGMATDSITSDGQSQIERTSQTFLSALSGSSILTGAGEINQCNTLDPVQLTIDNQMLDMVFRCLRGFEVTEKSRARDLIKKTGPGKEYISEMHTLEHFRTEYTLTHIFNHDSNDTWVEKGSKDLNQRAQEHAIKILKEHETIPLDKHTNEELNKIYDTF